MKKGVSHQTNLGVGDNSCCKTDIKKLLTIFEMIKQTCLICFTVRMTIICSCMGSVQQ